MADKATVRNAYGVPAMFAGSKTGSDDAAFVFVRVGNEERRMRRAEWDALPAWTGPRPSWGPKSGAHPAVLIFAASPSNSPRRMSSRFLRAGVLAASSYR